MSCNANFLFLITNRFEHLFFIWFFVIFISFAVKCCFFLSALYRCGSNVFWPLIFLVKTLILSSFSDSYNSVFVSDTVPQVSESLFFPFNLSLFKKNFRLSNFYCCIFKYADSSAIANLLINQSTEFLNSVEFWSSKISIFIVSTLKYPMSSLF